MRSPPAGVEFNFEFEVTYPIALAILAEDPNLEKMRFELVPKVYVFLFDKYFCLKKNIPLFCHQLHLLFFAHFDLYSISEENFWRNYFYRVSLICQANELSSMAKEGGAAASASRTSSTDAEPAG